MNWLFKLFGLCVHEYQTHVIFGAKGIYIDKSQCWKCRDSNEVWRGTRNEWRKRHGLSV